MAITIVKTITTADTASVTASGVVELATLAETVTGSDSVKAIVPSAAAVFDLAYTTATQNFVAEGDSNAAGSANGGVSFASLMMVLDGVAGRGTLTNLGTGGDTLISHVVGQYAATVYPLRPTGSILSAWLFNLVGVNDLSVLTESASYIAADSAYQTTAVADGFKFVDFTIPQRGGVLTQAQEVIRQEINAAKRARTTATALIDLDLLFPDPSDTTFFLSDQLHLNTTAHGIIAQECAAVVKGRRGPRTDVVNATLRTRSLRRASAARAPRAGLNWNGKNSNRASFDPNSTLLLAEGFSVAWTITMPAAVPIVSKGLWGMIAGAGATTFHAAGGFYCCITTVNTFVLRRVGSTPGTLSTNGSVSSGDYRQLVVSIGQWHDQTVDCLFTCTRAGVVTLYINGQVVTGTESTSGTPPGWADAMTPATVGFGYLAGAASASLSDTWEGGYHAFHVFNLALTAAEALAFHEGGFSRLPDLQWGNATEIMVNGTFAADTNFTKGAGVTISGGNAVWASVANVVTGLSQNLPVNRCRRHRYVLTLSAWTSGSVNVFQSSLQVGSITLAAGANYLEAVVRHASNGIALVAVGTCTFSLDTWTLKQIGAVASFGLADGLGYQAADSSTNLRHAALVMDTEPAWIARARTGAYRGTVSASGNTQLNGGDCLPAGARIERITVTAASAVTILVGNASGGSQIVASVLLGTSPTDLTLVTRYSSTADLWFNLDSAVSIAVEVVFSV